MTTEQSARQAGWSVRTVGEIASKPQYGWTTRAREGKGVKFLRTTDITRGSINWDSVPVCEEPPKDLAKYKLRRGDIVVSRAGSVGFSSLIDGSSPPDAVFASYLIRIRPDPAVVHPKFLSHFMRSPDYWRQVGEASVGIGLANVNGSKLAAMTVPIPPLHEQALLVSILDRTSDSRRSAGLHLASARQAVEHFKSAILAAACSGRLTVDWRERNPIHAQSITRPTKSGRQLRDIEQFDLDEIPDEWTWVQVNDLVPPDGLLDGPFGSNLKSMDYTPSGARVIRLENIGHLSFIDSKKTYVSKQKYRNLIRHAVHPEDIVFSSFVEENVRVCLLPTDLERETLAKADCFTLRPTNLVNRSYLAMQLASRRTYGMLASDIHGATRPRVNTTQLRSLPIPLCSSQEQDEIVRRFSEISAAAHQLLKRIDRAAVRAEQASQAVIAKVFRGEVTVNGSIHPGKSDVKSSGKEPAGQRRARARSA